MKELQDYEILYNSHKDFNPADSIIKAVSVTCDAKDMVGVTKMPAVSNIYVDTNTI